MRRASRQTVQFGTEYKRHLVQPRKEGTTIYVEIAIPRGLHGLMGKRKLVPLDRNIRLGYRPRQAFQNRGGA